jgi:hypothetical protein
MSLLWLALSTNPTYACGGLMCARPPLQAVPPIEQVGERIVFELRGGQVEMHVQIAYEGPVDAFAWVVPVPEVPELFVSTDELFWLLEALTAPQLVHARAWATCGRSSKGGGSDDTDVSVDTDYAFPSDPLVEVASRDAVGPYETAVLRGDTTEAVAGWLTQNGFDIPDGFDDAMAPYVASNQWFVALRMQKDRTDGELEPLGLRFPGLEATIPLILTRVAAQADMPVDVWVLGDQPAVPLGYAHVELNHTARLEATRPEDYSQILAEAVDAAGGQAFTTEYAGPVLGRGNLDWPGRYLDGSLETAISPACLVELVLAQGYPRTAKLSAVLDRWIPGASEMITNNSSPQACMLDEQRPVEELPEWSEEDKAGVILDLNTLFIEPVRHAEATLARNTVLSRLSTRISPAEMTADPRFRLAPGQPSVSQIVIAETIEDCRNDGVERTRMPDGTVIGRPTQTWLNNHNYLYQSMFYAGLRAIPALKVERYADDGSVEVLVDNTAAVEEEIDRLNRELGIDRVFGPLSDDCGCDGSGAGAGLGVAWLAALAAWRRGGQRRSLGAGSSGGA